MKVRKINLEAFHLEFKGRYEDVKMIIYATSRNNKHYELHISMPWAFLGYLKREINKILKKMKSKFEFLINES